MVINEHNRYKYTDNPVMGQFRKTNERQVHTNPNGNHKFARFRVNFHHVAVNWKIKAHVGINGRLFPPAEIRLLNFQLRDGLRCFHPPSLACLCHDLFVVMISVHKSTHTWPTLQKKKKECIHTGDTRWLNAYVHKVCGYTVRAHTHSYCCPLSGRVT